MSLPDQVSEEQHEAHVDDAIGEIIRGAIEL